MKFYTSRRMESKSVLFNVELDEDEIFKSQIYIKKLELVVLSKIANMIAGYYFKNNRQVIDSWLINEEEIKQMVAKAIVEKLTLEVKR